ncbi:MAG: hypothetical protein R6X16_01835 [Anaerolineae bacterium]
MSRHSPELHPLSLVLVALLGVSVLLLVASTGDWGLLGIAPGARLQLFGRGTLASEAVTPTTRSFSARDFRVRAGDTVVVTYALAGEGGSARFGVSLCTYDWFRPDCEMLLMEPLPLPAQGQAQVAIPARGRCGVDLWVRDYTGGLTLSWERQQPAVGRTP